MGAGLPIEVQGSPLKMNTFTFLRVNVACTFALERSVDAKNSVDLPHIQMPMKMHPISPSHPPWIRPTSRALSQGGLHVNQ